MEPRLKMTVSTRVGVAFSGSHPAPADSCCHELLSDTEMDEVASSAPEKP